MNTHKYLGWMVGCTAITAMIGCGGGEKKTDETKKTVSAEKIELEGAGASFPDPLYQAWFKKYSEDTEGVSVSYSSVGSSGGIQQFTDKLVDFGASDAAMTDEEMEKVEGGVQLLPMTAGAVVLCFNLKDADGNEITELKLSREAYPGIFLGEITMWNDPKIAETNPDLKLPEKPISVVYRADGSGTTFVFTSHLKEISPAWASGPGAGKTIKWPTGTGATKNDGVATAVKANDGSIGYVEYGFAKLQGLISPSLENKAGNFAAPSLEACQAALAGIKELPENLRIFLPDPEGDEAYPIVTYTWILCRKEMDAPEAKVKAMKACFEWCLTKGQTVSGKAGYVPLPESITEKVIAAMDNIKATKSE